MTTVVALDYMAQLVSHMAAAEKADGEAIVKSEAFYGVSFDSAVIRGQLIDTAKAHGFKSQFSKDHGNWALRLRKRTKQRGRK